MQFLSSDTRCKEDYCSLLRRFLIRLALPLASRPLAGDHKSVISILIGCLIKPLGFFLGLNFGGRGTTLRQELLFQYPEELGGLMMQPFGRIRMPHLTSVLGLLPGSLEPFVAAFSSFLENEATTKKIFNTIANKIRY